MLKESNSFFSVLLVDKVRHPIPLMLTHDLKHRNLKNGRLDDTKL